jgi:hypothetical protein
MDADIDGLNGAAELSDCGRAQSGRGAPGAGTGSGPAADCSTDRVTAVLALLGE